MRVNRKILITPLNWGLGHASRCVPVIRELVNRGFEVLIASEGASLALLKREFPVMKFFELPSYQIRYKNNPVLSLAVQLPDILITIKREHTAIGKIVASEKIDTIISDNRYGCYNSSTNNIFICHQHHLITPEWLKLFSLPINFCHNKLLSRFDEHWIPDLESRFFSGKMSNTSFKNIKFIGSVSRFQKKSTTNKYQVAAIISGPEPQRMFFENLIKKELVRLKFPSIMICGKVGESQKSSKEQSTEIVNFLSSNALNEVINQSEIVLCRSGYSSVMDMAALKKKVIFIPTPGQPEQQYLAKRFQEFKIAPSFHQNDFNLESAINSLEQYRGFEFDISNKELLTQAINSI